MRKLLIIKGNLILDRFDMAAYNENNAISTTTRKTMQTIPSPVLHLIPGTSESDLAVNISSLANPTLERLLAEVKNDEQNTMGSYDRAHNRHNRS